MLRDADTPVRAENALVDTPESVNTPGLGLVTACSRWWWLCDICLGSCLEAWRQCCVPEVRPMIMTCGELIQYKVHFFYGPYLFIHLPREFVIVNGLILGRLYNHIPSCFLLAGKNI